MRPAILRTSEEAFTASGKSPRIWVRAMRKRLPKLWPLSPRPDRKRYWKRRDSSAESSLRATMQLRMSPGGGTANSRRRRPELAPPAGTGARREHVELAAQASGTAAIVGHGDDGGDVHRGRRGAGGPGVVLQPFEDTGQAVTPADGDYAEWGVVFHARGLGRRVDIFTTPSFPDRAGPGAGPGGPAERNPHPGARSCGCAVPVQWRGGDSPGRWQDRPKVPGPAPAHSVYGRSREQWPTPSPGGCGLRRRCAR